MPIEHDEGANVDDACAHSVDSNEGEIGGQVEPLANGDEGWVPRCAHRHGLSRYVEWAKTTRYGTAGRHIIGGIPTPANARPVGDHDKKCRCTSKNCQEQSECSLRGQQHAMIVVP